VSHTVGFLLIIDCAVRLLDKQHYQKTYSFGHVLLTNSTRIFSGMEQLVKPSAEGGWT
jgi:hypothetical protein